jgi:hypothetical protein
VGSRLTAEPLPPRAAFPQGAEQIGVRHGPIMSRADALSSAKGLVSRHVLWCCRRRTQAMLVSSVAMVSVVWSRLRPGGVVRFLHLTGRRFRTLMVIDLFTAIEVGRGSATRTWRRHSSVVRLRPQSVRRGRSAGDQSWISAPFTPVQNLMSPNTLLGDFISQPGQYLDGDDL